MLNRHNCSYGVLAALILLPAAVQAQTAPVPAPASAGAQDAPPTPDATTGITEGDIIVTAQRQSQGLQKVPIAVSAFTAEALTQQQIVNPLALQQTLPSVTFTKTNFSGGSFTIRGIGDLCVGVTCDQATAAHVNDMPLQDTRMFDAEFFDLERIEVLRGPQGTLFGRNATSGVVNFITARPNFTAVGAAGEVEYGNFDSKRVRGMVNLPLSDTIAVRVAGTYLKRDGFTRNLFDGRDIDGRDLYGVRGTVSWQPGANTRIDVMAYYSHEKDDRARVQKQLCHRDPTGILGCLPDRLGNDVPNGNALINTIATSREFLTLAAPPLVPFALGSVYGGDPNLGLSNPADPRTVDADVPPTYRATEQQYMMKLRQDLGRIALTVTGGYSSDTLASTADLYLSTQRPLAGNAGLVALDTLARPGSPYAFLGAVRSRLIPNGAGGNVCQSALDPSGVGLFGGRSIGCTPQSLDYERVSRNSRTYSAEVHVDSAFDGPFNFLAGAIYFDSNTKNSFYSFGSFGLDYASGLLGSAATATTPGVAGNSYLISPFFNNLGELFTLKSYGVFGETYWSFGDGFKLTVGARYNHDEKYLGARTTILSVVAPIGAQRIQDGYNFTSVDFDPSLAGIQPLAINRARFGRVTGRAVLEYQLTSRNMLYASYARGYKSGGINPPAPPEVNVGATFAPESVDAFEIGSKNSVLGGQLRLNLTGFYYRYRNLQLGRTVAQTAINDNLNAAIYGAELEAIVTPVPRFVVNINASYLRSKVQGDTFFPDARDPSGGRSDVVIIKDLSNASNCAVAARNGGTRATVNGFVGAVNGALGLAAPVAIPGLTATGAYGVCSVLATQSAATAGQVEVLGAGVPVNIRGRSLPQAPRYKVSVGAQYRIPVGSGGAEIVPRADLAYTSELYTSVFNDRADRVSGYAIVNAQVQLNLADERYYLRGFVRNLTNNNAITGQYLGDQSLGLFTNVFTLEPHQYGIAAGFKF